jgi:prepilin-type N-terminal cleavage/methylation domain-containing protein
MMDKTLGRSGFTVVELLISVIIIAIGVVGFATAVGLVSTELWIGNRDTEVSLLMADQAELLKSLPYDSVKSGTRVEGDYQLAWTVQNGNPKRVILAATYARHSGGSMADTIVVLIPQ